MHGVEFDVPVKKELAIRPQGFNKIEPFLYNGLQVSSTSLESRFCNTNMELMNPGCRQVTDNSASKN
jgi:hypothetical protein